MGREIKFRAKRLDNNEWVYGHYTQGTGSNHYITQPNGSVWEVDGETVGQFTEVKDMHNNELYEWDFIKTSQGILLVVIGAFFEVINGKATGNNGNGVHAHDTWEKTVVAIGGGFAQDMTIEKDGDMYEFKHLFKDESN